MIPGMNILSLATRVIKPTSVDYYSYKSVVTNNYGIDVVTYNAKVVIATGSVQAIKRQRYEKLGLDLSKRYISWHVPGVDVVDLKRGVSGDVIEVLGRRWQLVGSSDWFLIDGWKSVIAVDIGEATGAVTNA